MRRPLLLLLTGAVAPLFTLAACSSASSTAPPAARVTIPPAARTVTLSLKYGNYRARKPPAPVTVTSPAKVRKVAELVADQPPGPTGTTSCPADDGAALDLVFRADPGGPVLATASVSLSGCEFTGLKVGGKLYGLGKYGAGPSTATRVLQAAGLAWKVPPMEPPLPG
ncbi:MAG TPA: hypothetical protein VGG83_17725 [Trebonia sp.]